MATSSPKFARRERALEAARRRLRRLEIETHRIKAHLARLEAEYEDDVADRLSRTLRRRSKTNDRYRAPSYHVAGAASSNARAPEAPGLQFAASPQRDTWPPDARIDPSLLASVPAGHSRVSTARPGLDPPLRSPSVADVAAAVGAVRAVSRGSRRTYERAGPSIVFSLVLHAVVLLLCLTLGFATLVQPQIPLFASPADGPEDERLQLNEVKIESPKLEDSELQNVVSEVDQFNLADDMLHQFEPAALGAGAQPLGEVGQLDALPNQLSALMAGAGSPGNGPASGPKGDAVFFGTRSQGNRFVYVVDNSSSMKGGRLDAATAEVVRSVDALSPRQAFYVIFVSDQTYPMFFPQPAAGLLPATAANKKRLEEWLPNAILASGKNRELIKAMDLAASLRPDVAYLLWDGDMRYSEKVRLEVLTHLARPNGWRFPVHTLGMGVTSLDAEYNLTAIAQAHGGSYRRVDVPPARQQ